MPGAIVPIARTGLRLANVIPAGLSTVGRVSPVQSAINPLLAAGLGGAALGSGITGVLKDSQKGVMPTREQEIEEYLRKREARQDMIRSLLKAVNPMPGGYNPTIYGGNI